MRTPDEILGSFQSERNENGVKAAGESLFREIYGDTPVPAALTSEQFAHRQSIVEDLANQGLLPQLSITWVNQFKTHIDANGDNIITSDEVTTFADGLDGQVDNQFGDPLAEQLSVSFVEQYGRLIALSSEGPSDGLAFTELDRAATYIERMTLALQDEALFAALDTAGFGGEQDRKIGWHDISNIVDGGHPEIAADLLPEYGVTIDDLRYLRDNWTRHEIQQFMGSGGDVITPQSLDVLSAETADALKGIYDHEGRLTYIMLPGTTAFWLRDGDVWSMYASPGQYNPEALISDIMGEPILDEAEGTVTFNHGDGTRSVFKYSPDGQLLQVEQSIGDASATVNFDSDGNIADVELPDGSTLTQNEEGEWVHTMGSSFLGTVAGSPAVTPDGRIAFSYGMEVGMSSSLLFSGGDGRWVIALRPESSEDPTLVEVHFPDESTHYVMRYSDASLDYAQVRLNNGAVVNVEDREITSIQLPDGSTIEPADPELPRDQWTWVHRHGDTITPVGRPQFGIDDQILLTSGERQTSMFPYLHDQVQGDETYYDLLLADGTTQTFNGDGQIVRWTLGAGASIEYSYEGDEPGVSAFTDGENTWTLNRDTRTWLLNGEPTAIAPQFSGNGEREFVSVTNPDGSRIVYGADGLRTIYYSNGTVAVYGESSNQVARIDLPGEGYFSQDNGRWIYTGPDEELCQEALFAGAPEVHSDGSITVLLVDGSSRHFQFDDSGVRVIADTDASESEPQVLTRTYDEAGRMLTLTLPNGRVTTIDYDESGEAETVTITGIGDAQVYTRGEDGRWTGPGLGPDGEPQPLNALEVSDDGVLRIWGHPDNRLTTFSPDGIGTSDVMYTFSNGSTIDAVEIVLPNEDSAITRGGIHLEVRTDGAVVYFDSQGNEQSVDLPDDTRLVRSEDGTWLHMESEGDIISEVAAPECTFDIDNGASIRIGDRDLLGSNGQWNLERSDGVVQVYDQEGNLLSESAPDATAAAGDSLQIFYSADGRPNAVNLPDGTRWTFDPTTRTWFHSVYDTTSDAYIEDNVEQHRGFITLTQGGVRLNDGGDTDQIYNLDGSASFIYRNGVIAQYAAGSSNLLRIDMHRGDVFLYQQDNSWIMHGEAGDVPMGNITGAPVVNGDGSVTVNYQDGSASTYQFNTDGTISNVLIDRPGDQGYVFLDYRDGEICRATFSSDQAKDANDYVISKDGAFFYAYGGRVEQLELTPEGVLTTGGTLVLAADGGFRILTSSGVENHFRDGTFNVVASDGRVIVQSLANGCTYETDGDRITSVRFENGTYITYDAAQNAWSYTTLSGRQISILEPTLENGQLGFHVGDRVIPVFSSLDQTYNLATLSGSIETFTEAGTRMRLSTADGNIVLTLDETGENYQTALIGTQTWTYDEDSRKWRSDADNRLADITPGADGVHIHYDDNTEVEYSWTGMIADISFPNGAFLSYAADGSIDAVRTANGSEWRLMNGAWDQVAGPETGVVLSGVSPANGNLFNGDAIVFSFADQSTYRFTQSGGWEQLTAPYLADDAIDDIDETATEETVSPEGGVRQLPDGIIVNDQIIDGVRQVTITRPGETAPRRIIFDSNGIITSVFQPDGTELRLKAATSEYEVFRLDPLTGAYTATTEVKEGTFSLNENNFVLTFTQQGSDGSSRTEYRPDGSWTVFSPGAREVHNVNQSVVTYETIEGRQLVTQVRYPDGETSQFAYDASGKIIRMTVQPDGLVYIPNAGNPYHWDAYTSDGGEPPTYTRAYDAPGIDGELSIDGDGNLIVRSADGTSQVFTTAGGDAVAMSGGDHLMTPQERSQLAGDLNADPLFWRRFTDENGCVDMEQVDQLYAEFASLRNPTEQQVGQMEILRRIQDSRQVFAAADGEALVLTDFISENLVIGTQFVTSDIQVPVVNAENTFVFPSNITVADMASISLFRQGIITPNVFNNPHAVEILQEMGLIPEGVTSYNQLLNDAAWRTQNGIPDGITNEQQMFAHLLSIGRISPAATAWSQVASAEEVRVMEMNSYRSDRSAEPLESPPGSGRYLKGWNSIAVGQVFILPPALEHPALPQAA